MGAVTQPSCPKLKALFGMALRQIEPSERRWFERAGVRWIHVAGKGAWKARKQASPKHRV